MKVKSITIKGFRGFNDERTIDFHEKLTLICAKNSYGKTSISEALEWLLYGITSKVKNADSKEEYRNSYRNRHFPDSQTPSVKAIIVDGKSEFELRGELVEEDTNKKYVNNTQVEEWQFSENLSKAPEPFILQHALKYLLLVKPNDRFQGFARLLGLEDLEQIQGHIVSLCTKPDAAVPTEAKQLVKDIEALVARIASQPSLVVIDKSLKKGKAGIPETYKAIVDECKRRVPPGTTEESVIQLLKIREEAVSKIFKGHIALLNYSAHEQQANSSEEQIFLTYVTDEFVKEYAQLISLRTVQHIINRAQFFGLGIEFIGKKPGICPFCGQSVNDILAEHIKREHESLTREKDCNIELGKSRDRVLKILKELREHLESYQLRHIGKVETLLSLEPNLSQLEQILAPKHPILFKAVESAITLLSSAKQKLEELYGTVTSELNKIEASISETKEDSNLMKTLGERLVTYVANARSFDQIIADNVSPVADADQLLKYELDALAGTEDITILIDLLEKRSDIEKKYDIDNILEGLKDLRKTVVEFVGNRMLSAFSGELTTDVMEWYGQIKTTGDPDVHFGGFDLERTAKGEFKARKVQIKAMSYGKELVSAVSSLSESKLNALGLCVSIATNLKGNSPFEFLIIDDPIQSWDAEHEVQFIEVIKKLVERGKQVILLSHNEQWIKQVRSGCRTLNGFYYQITGYTKEGPQIIETPWEKWVERLNEVDAITKDPEATGSTLQRAEEEIRISIEDILSELWFKKKEIHKKCHKINSSEARKMLVECGINDKLVDHIIQTYDTTDPAHHAQASYAPNRERIKCYHSWVHELGRLLT